MLRLPCLLLAAFIATPAKGSSLDFRRILLANDDVVILATASDKNGNVYVAGSTRAFNFPTKNAYQPRNHGSAVVVSDDAGRTWRSSGFIPDLPHTGVNAPIVHPSNSNLLMAVGVYGIYRSIDAGESWQTVVDLNAPGERQRIGYLDEAAFDPFDASLVYVASTTGVLKSTNAGLTWTLMNSGTAPGHCCVGSGLAVDPFDPRRLVYTVNERAYLSTDAGLRWRQLELPSGVQRPRIRLDPHAANVWYLYSYEGAWKSTDAGVSWRRIRETSGLYRFLMADPNVPNRLYSFSSEGLFRTHDGGGKWEPVAVDPLIDPLHSSYGISLAVQPGNSNHLVLSGQTKEPFPRTVSLFSTDGGRSWQPMGAIRSFHSFRFDPARPSRLYAGGTPTSDAFVAKLDVTGELLWATYLGGQGEDSATALYVDGLGSVCVAGRTESTDFPAATARFYSGIAPSLFAARLDDSGRPIHAALLGEGSLDELHAMSVDGAGRIYLGGRTVSSRFPLSPNPIAGFVETGGGFALRLSADGGAIEYSTAVKGSVQSIAADPEGGFYVGGTFEHAGSPVQLFRFDEDGSLLRAAGLPVAPARIIAAEGGGVILAGTASIADAAPVSPGALQTKIDTSCPHDSGSFGLRPQQRPLHMTDVWVAELDRDGGVVWATFLGGNCREDARDLVVSADGSVWVAGESYSQNLPVVDGLFGPPAVGFKVPFVARIGDRGARLLFSTTLEYGADPRLAVAPAEAVYLSVGPPSGDYTRPLEGKLFRLSSGAGVGPFIRSVTNAFNLQAGPVAPLEIVRVEVPGLEPSAETNLGLNPPGGAPIELGGVAIEFDAVRARIVDVWRGGLICVTPRSLRGKQLSSVVIIQQGVRSSPFYVPVTDNKLVFFDQVRNEDGSLNTPNRPAPPFPMLTFYFTGSSGYPAELSVDGVQSQGMPLAALSPVEGFVEGLFVARVRMPVLDGTYTARIVLQPGAGATSYPPLQSTVSIHARK